MEQSKFEQEHNVTPKTLGKRQTKANSSSQAGSRSRFDAGGLGDDMGTSLALGASSSKKARFGSTTLRSSQSYLTDSTSRRVNVGELLMVESSDESDDELDLLNNSSLDPPRTIPSSHFYAKPSKSSSQRRINVSSQEKRVPSPQLSPLRETETRKRPRPKPRVRTNVTMEKRTLSHENRSVDDEPDDSLPNVSSVLDSLNAQSCPMNAMPSASQSEDSDLDKAEPFPMRRTTASSQSQDSDLGNVRPFPMKRTTSQSQPRILDVDKAPPFSMKKTVSESERDLDLDVSQAVVKPYPIAKESTKGKGKGSNGPSAERKANGPNKRTVVPFPMTTATSIESCIVKAKEVEKPELASFPMAPKVTNKGKTSAAKEPEKPVPAPFPMKLPSMSSQEDKVAPPRGKKRESPKSKGGEDETPRARKRNKHVGNGVAVDLGRFGSISLDSSSPERMSVSPERLQKKLCPFCDEPWPDKPSTALLKLLGQVKQRAWKDPRYTNPEGLSAPIEVFVSLCTMHRSERSYIPDGIAQGWPTRIDFGAIPGRLQGMKKKFARIIADPSKGPFFQAAYNDIVKKGSRIANSARGQFDTFERCQPGYYGEQGMIVIYRALKQLFPDLSPVLCDPLLPDDFVRQVLVPEAAILLIREDMGLPRVEALKILLASRQYGLAQFPDRDEETQRLYQDTQLSPFVFTPRREQDRRPPAAATSDLPASRTRPTPRRQLSASRGGQSTEPSRAKAADMNARSNTRDEWCRNMYSDQSEGEEDSAPPTKSCEKHDHSWLLSDDTSLEWDASQDHDNEDADGSIEL